MLQAALKDRLSDYERDLTLHAILGALAIVFGVSLFCILWWYFRQDQGTFIKELAGTATGLVTFGASGAIRTKFMTLRDEIRQGKDWLELHQSALGPPPDALLGKIEEKILAWLEG